MAKAVAKISTNPISAEALSKVILHGDLKGLTPVQKVEYYNAVCAAVGLNPLTKPFDYITLSGKEVLYANKGCAEQLREIHKVSLEISQISTVSDVYVVIVKASMPDGRFDAGTGAVPVGNLKGEAMANAFMKCETKAKRRATLSICGLNMLDETEVASIPDAKPPVAASVPPTVVTAAVAPVILPKETPAGATTAKSERKQIGDELNVAIKALCLKPAEVAEWATNKFGEANLTKLSNQQLREFRDELYADVKGK